MCEIARIFFFLYNFNPNVYREYLLSSFFIQYIGEYCKLFHFVLCQFFEMERSVYVMKQH